MRPVVITVGPLAAANAAGIAASQSLAGPGMLALTSSGPVVLDAARKVVVTSAGNDSGRVFTITGTNWSGSPVGETLTGGNAGAAVSALDYLSVSSVRVNGATASTVTVGTNGTASSPWFRMDDFGTSSVSLGFSIYGQATGTLQYSFDDPNSLANPVLPAVMTWLNSPDPNLNGMTISRFTSLSQNVTFIRVLLTAGTGSITMNLIQGGSPPA